MPEPEDATEPEDAKEPRDEEPRRRDAVPARTASSAESPAEADSASRATPSASDAARRAIAAPEPITWRELVRDFVRPGRAQVVFAAILLVCGLAVAMQVRAQTSEADYSTLRRADLIQLLDDLTAQSRQLESEIADLEATQRLLQGGANSEKVAREEAQRRLDVLGILGGTVPAQGPGVRFTISDPQHKVTPELLLNTIEEMRDAGAEVMAINGTVRVVASTWFGPGPNGSLVVSGEQITRPIKIDVIGDPHALTEAARFSGGLVSEVESSRVGGTVSIVSDDKLRITAVVAPPAHRFAKPA